MRAASVELREQKGAGVMGQTDITLRQLKTVLNNHVKLYEEDQDGNKRVYTDLYRGEMKDVPEELLDRTVYVIWAKSEEHFEATIMIELEREETP